MKHILVTKWVIPHIKCITKYKNGFPSRTFSNQVVMNVFDRKTKLQQKERQSKLPDNHVYDYLKREVRLNNHFNLYFKELTNFFNLQLMLYIVSHLFKLFYFIKLLFIIKLN